MRSLSLLLLFLVVVLCLELVVSRNPLERDHHLPPHLRSRQQRGADGVATEQTVPPSAFSTDNDGVDDDSADAAAGKFPRPHHRGRRAPTVFPPRPNRRQRAGVGADTDIDNGAAVDPLDINDNTGGNAASPPMPPGRRGRDRREARRFGTNSPPGSAAGADETTAPEHPQRRQRLDGRPQRPDRPARMGRPPRPSIPDELNRPQTGAQGGEETMQKREQEHTRAPTFRPL